MSGMGGGYFSTLSTTPRPSLSSLGLAAPVILIGRRTFLAGASAALLGAPLATEGAAPAKIPRIGFLTTPSPTGAAAYYLEWIMHTRWEHPLIPEVRPVPKKCRSPRPY